MQNSARQNLSETALSTSTQNISLLYFSLENLLWASQQITGQKVFYYD